MSVIVDHREIIRLVSLDHSNVGVSKSCGSSRNNEAEVWKLAQVKDHAWPIPETFTNKDLHELLYPERSAGLGRKIPDYEYIYQELARLGVTLSLLWAEYCAQYADEYRISYQHSQFNEKYHTYAKSKKATLCIKRKPGELMEVDWVGDTLTVFIEASGEGIRAYVFVLCLS